MESIHPVLRRAALVTNSPSLSLLSLSLAVSDIRNMSTTPTRVVNNDQKQYKTSSKTVPFMLKQRSSTAFISLTVALGIVTDLSGYGLIVPVVPFRLQSLGYSNVGAKTGWLVAAYAAGLIVSSPPIAYLGNRSKGRRIPLLIALGFMAGAVILFMETASFTAMIISRILQGISGTGIWTLGLSLITDSVPEERVGTVMGQVMIGFSLGSLIGPPVGGVLYARMGYRAPFIFALCLLFCDFLLRLLMIEKHVALEHVKSGYDIPGFEAPGYKVSGEPSLAGGIELGTTGPQEGEEEGEGKHPPPQPRSPWPALLDMVTQPRPVTNFLLTVLNGIILGGVLDTGMTLWLQHQYGLSSLGAGLVFIAAVVPSFFASPFAGWASDKYGAKWIAVIGLLMSIPAYSLLIIKGPLPLFIFFLVILGFSLSFFLTPTMQDLSVVVALTPGLPSTAAYGCFNMMYSIGAFVGPIIGGQLIGALEIRKGWIALCVLSSGLATAILPALVLFLGGDLQWRRKKPVERVRTGTC
ncbi:MFS general substrate transporter [Meredithblackwellia eburnea MCA 4105]